MPKTLNKLIVIDAQNDFSDTPVSLLPVVTEVIVEGRRTLVTEVPALPVPGGHKALMRTAEFIQYAGPKLNRIVATMDAHPYVAIERTTFWRDAGGNEVKPFTQITSEDVLAGRFAPNHPQRIEPISGKPLGERVVELLQLLEAAGKVLMVWPVHCVKGTWGASLHPVVSAALNDWELQSNFPVVKVDKGGYPLVEHYGVFEAETPLEDVPSTRFNGDLANTLNADVTIFAGLASSHCVAASYDQLLRHRKGSGRGIVILTDCMSPVSGFEQAQGEFFARAKAAGSVLMGSTDCLEFLRKHG